MTPLERKIIRRAAEIVAATDLSCTVSLMAAMNYYDYQTPILEIFRRFFGVGDCPFADWQGDPEELRTIRVLLLETFLIFDGELG